MGDLLENSEVFKKLGFDGSSQWILHDESFQKFFNWFSENITDDNILTENEVLEEIELKNRNCYLQGGNLEVKLKSLEEEYPLILKYTDDDVVKMEIELQQTKKMFKMYDNLGNKMQKTKNNINRELHELENVINEHENKVQNLFKSCSQKAKEIQEQQKANKKLCIELNESFTKTYSPPLFIHQLPLDQYMLKCDSFMQYLTLYLQDNFKFQDFLENDEVTSTEDTFELNSIKNQIYYYSVKDLKAKTQLAGLQRMTEELDVSKIHNINISEFKKETKELEIINNNFDIKYNTLMNDLNISLGELTQQKIDLVSDQNTKHKLERASQRFENLKFLSKIVSDALMNTELIWILMQLDSEKIKNRVDNTEQLQKDSQMCNKRIEMMRQIQILSPNCNGDLYISKISEILSKYSIGKINNSTKLCLYEYEKFNRMFENALTNLSIQRSYGQFQELLKDLNSLENILKPYIFNGPVQKAIFENVLFLKPIFKSQLNEKNISNKIKKLRSEFHENITIPMNTNKLYECNQLLWIWFLTEPRKVIDAIEEVQKIASTIPALTGIKTLCGIKRK